MVRPKRFPEETALQRSRRLEAARKERWQKKFDELEAKKPFYDAEMEKLQKQIQPVIDNCPQCNQLKKAKFAYCQDCSLVFEKVQVIKQ